MSFSYPPKHCRVLGYLRRTARLLKTYEYKQKSKFYSFFTLSLNELQANIIFLITDSLPMQTYQQSYHFREDNMKIRQRMRTIFKHGGQLPYSCINIRYVVKISRRRIIGFGASAGKTGFK
jgi:hypothetical protein